MENKFFYQKKLEGPYYRELPSEETWKFFYGEMVKQAIGLLTMFDPEKAPLYQQIPEKYPKETFDPLFMELIRDGFAGTFGPTSPMFENDMKRNTLRIAIYLRFILESHLERENLDKFQVKNPMYIMSLPRCGSTFTHRVLGSVPHAKAIAMYQLISPGAKTMNVEGRMKMASLFCTNLVEGEGGKDLHKSHALDVVTAPEEDLLFQDQIGLQTLGGLIFPKYEHVRERLFVTNYDYAYHATMDMMKMFAFESDFKEGDYFCTKTATNFPTLSPFLRIQCKDEYNPRIVWLHREPIGQIKSAILLLLNCRGGFEGDIGFDDIDWINKNVIEMYELMLKNSIAVREQWIAENPERKKFIIDVGFLEMIQKPIETAKKIYDYFGMEFSQEIEDCMKHTIENDDPQKGHGRRAHEEEMYTFNHDEVRERFKFYFEKFGEFIPNYWGKKE